MPAQELLIPYRSAGIKTLRLLTFATFPLWAVMAPLVFVGGLAGFVITLLFGSVYILTHGIELLGTFSSLASLSFSGAICYAGIRALVLSSEDKLVLNDSGMVFPANFWSSLKLRRHRAWDDLGNVQLDCTSPDKGFITFIFRSGGYARVKLTSIPSQLREQLLLALEVWAKHAVADSQITQMLDHFHDERTRLGQDSYTAIWQNELNRHFASTAFVPLQKGQELRSGSISIVQPLAFGGLSAIYLAQMNGIDLVVVKESVVESLQDPSLLAKAEEMFSREAKLLMTLSHPRIAKVYDHFVEKGRSYLLLEHVAGENIRTVVKQAGAQPEQVVLEWMEQIAEVLDYLHSQNPPIIHRDLTPDNMVLRNQHEVVLIDFGAANEFVGTATGTLVGKQAYISTEQFRGKANLKSDLYSLGATMYFLLTGVDPEPLSQSYPRCLQANISADLDHLVASCTALEASERPPSAHYVLEQIKVMRASALKTCGQQK